MVTMLLCMMAFASAEVLDYDTFTREDSSSLGVTEGDGREYVELFVDGSPQEPSINNGMFYIDYNSVGYTGYEMYWNFSDAGVTEFTAYMRLRSNSPPNYMELNLYEVTGGQTETIITPQLGYFEGYYPVLGGDENSTILSSEWVDIYVYRNSATNYSNVTISDGLTTHTSEGTYSRNDFNAFYIYYDSESSVDTVLIIDEWAVCDGYDLTCSPPEAESTGYTAQYQADDIAGASMDIFVKIVVTIGFFITLIVVIFGYGYVKKKF